MKPWLVFVHGIGGSNRVWPDQEAYFAGRARVLCWNIPGYGGRPLPEDFSFAGLAQQLIADLQAFGIERFALVGHSFGGMIAQQVARDFPHVLSHMVLSGTSPAFGSPDGDFQKRFMADRLGPLDAGRTMAEIADAIVRSLVAPGCPPGAIAVARQSMEQVAEATYRASMELLVTFDLRSDLSTIAVPTLVLAAGKDTSAPAPMMEKMASRIPGARYVCIEDAGHLANLEQPDEFNRAIAAFLEDNDNG